ncbi:hypothetical protein Drorol1_Dr00004108 [Drosera rotundifolia]
MGCFTVEPHTAVHDLQSTVHVRGQDAGQRRLFLRHSGIINDQLGKVVAQKCLDDPDFIVRRIHVYTNDAYTLLLEMKHSIDLPDVDFTKLAGHAQMLHGKSSRIGAEHMRLACTGLIQACAEKDRSKISRALTWAETEFDKTRNALESIAQMEQRIIRVKNKLKK